jgi:hypothetical protein
MRIRNLLILFLLPLVIASTGCATVYRVRRPSKVVVATSNDTPAVYVSKTNTATLPGQEVPKPSLMQIGGNGLVKSIGVFYNKHPFDIVLDVTSYEVCFGSELEVARPKVDDPRWLKPGALHDVVIPPSGSSPWIRVDANGGYKVFVYRFPLGAGRIGEQIVKLPVDFYAGDHICPGNRQVDWYWAAGYDINRYREPFCSSTRFLR